MPGETENNDIDNTVANFNEGFLEGVNESASDDVDPLDFADKPDTDPKKETAPDDDSDNSSEAASADDLDGADGAEGDGDAPAAEVPEKPAEPEKPAAVSKDQAADIYDMLDKRLPKEQPLEQPKPEPKAEKPAEPEPEKPALTEDEVARLKELNTEWKDVSEMVALQLKSVSDTIAKEVSKQVADIKKDFEARLQPVQQSVETSAAERYDAAVSEVHPEVYDKTQAKEFGDALGTWVNSQPEYLRQAYMQAFNSANPQDAIDLLTRFKADTGRDTQASEETGGADETPAPEEAAAKDDKKKRLRLMKKPTSRQTKGADSDDPLDFEGGFKEMVREMERAG